LPYFFIDVTSTITPAFDEFFGHSFVPAFLSLDQGGFVVWKKKYPLRPVLHLLTGASRPEVPD
jgi:hypothetical protein